ncbi:hypothetical protein LEUCIP111803_02415 [Leucobacter soli]|uniref:Uncharacterized protein n=1 Tax=Leucobacter soli TaxID=2812850 RepID=A0A916NQ66_9MICO|nr:hypothetical protein LEUCIP111803_02415 [Leucobacter soli]
MTDRRPARARDRPRPVRPRLAPQVPDQHGPARPRPVRAPLSAPARVRLSAPRRRARRRARAARLQPQPQMLLERQMQLERLPLPAARAPHRRDGAGRDAGEPPQRSRRPSAVQRSAARSSAARSSAARSSAVRRWRSRRPARPAPPLRPRRSRRRMPPLPDPSRRACARSRPRSRPQRQPQRRRVPLTPARQRSRQQGPTCSPPLQQAARDPLPRPGAGRDAEAPRLPTRERAHPPMRPRLRLPTRTAEPENRARTTLEPAPGQRREPKESQPRSAPNRSRRQPLRSRPPRRQPLRSWPPRPPRYRRPRYRQRHRRPQAARRRRPVPGAIHAASLARHRPSVTASAPRAQRSAAAPR